MELTRNLVAQEPPELAKEEPTPAKPRFLHELGGELARAVLRWSIGVWGTVDVLLCFGGFILAHYLSPRYSFAQSYTYNIGVVATIFSAAAVCSNYALGLYDRHNLTSLGRILRYAAVASLMALAITTVVMAWVGFARIGRIVLFDAFLIAVVGMTAFRLLARVLATQSKIRVMFLGQRAHFRALERELRYQYRDFYYRPAYVDHPTGSPCEREDMFRRAIAQHGPDEIVVEDNDAIILDLLRESSDILRNGCEIRSYAAYFEELLGQIPVETIDHRGLLGDGFMTSRHGKNLVKRLCDILLSMTGLILGAPLMLLCMAGVKLTSHGPIFYSQVRVGRYGRPFDIYKFRSMRIDAEKNGAVWAKKSDDRVTLIGRIMRKTRLDELPQLWNILRGDMSFVGPRPERPEFVASLRKEISHYDLRHLVPPGLTGWAQVRYRYGASVEDARRKLAFDLYYFRHYSPLFDLAICIRTVVAMAKGAR